MDLVEGADFYFDGGLMVFTAAYLLRRGTCCESNCRHCPYGEGLPRNRKEPRWVSRTPSAGSRPASPEPREKGER